MRIPGKKGLQSSARWLRSRFVSRGLILGYHRVADEPDDPYSLCVTPENFFSQMEIIREYATTPHIQDMVFALKSGNIPPRAIALTFDDGYADTLYNAKPVLEKHRIPATVFVTTGYLGNEFWWDKLFRFLLKSDRSTGELCLRIGDQSYKWILSETADNSQRERVLWSIYRLLRRSPEDVRQRILDQIQAWAGSAPENHVLKRSLTPEELVSLFRGELIDIGAHSMSHSDLAMMSKLKQEYEIRESKEALEQFIGRPVLGFSYPDGSFTKETLAIVKEAGFNFACASYNDVVWRRSNLFSLPRFWVPDVDGKRLYHWLKNWL